MRYDLRTSARLGKAHTQVAQKHIVRLIDDLTGADAAETVRFALDGSLYEIDLSEENAQRLREALRVYIANGRRAVSDGPGGAHPAHAPRRTTRAEREQTAAIRAWGRANGFRIGDKGRIPTNVIDAYNASH